MSIENNSTRGKKTKFNFDPETGDYYDDEFENAMSILDELDIEEEDYEY